MGMTSVRMPDELLDREELKQRRKQETLASWENYKVGRVIDGDEMRAWLDSWGTETTA